MWNTEVVPLLASAPKLRAITVLRKLQDEHPGQFPDGTLRTLQRHMRRWRTAHGPAKEGFFGALAGGTTPREVLEKFKTLQMVDVVLPTDDGRELTLSRTTQPEADHRMLLQQLRLQLPVQPPPRITAKHAAAAFAEPPL